MEKERLIATLFIDEGKRNNVYLDSKGVETIGVGRNLRDRGLTDEEIAYLLRNDIRAVEYDLDVKLPWWRSLSEARQQVLANMCFNMGITRLLGFKKMLAAAREGAYDEASTEMLNSKWASDVGNRAKRLANEMREG